MDVYHIWADLAEGASDHEFGDAVRAYCERLESDGHIAGWRLTRRKLGLGHPRLPEWHITLEFTGLAQLDAAFDRVATRSGQIEGLHHAVNSRVGEVFFALYRDFPDANRVRGEELF